MRPVLRELVEQLKLERIEDTIFRGQSQDLGWGAIFGGQVLGQALSAAAQTAPGDRQVHSLHGYFLRQGDATRPVVYTVDCIRDGRSFTTRRVVALQGGKAIFNLAASFQVEETGLSHADEMPDAPDPESLKSELAIAQKFADLIPESLRKMALAERPIEIRAVEWVNVLAPKKIPPHRRLWYRAVDALPDDPAIHRYLLAYASDFNFLATSMFPHAVTWLSPGMQVASLDHSMWFHRPFRMDDWLLYVIDSPSACCSRGLVRGQFFSRDGKLVASTAQEGLIRQWEKPKQTA